MRPLPPRAMRVVGRVGVGVVRLSQLSHNARPPTPDPSPPRFAREEGSTRGTNEQFI